MYQKLTPASFTTWSASHSFVAKLASGVVLDCRGEERAEMHGQALDLSGTYSHDLWVVTEK